jgi:hypothetical protein
MTYMPLMSDHFLGVKKQARHLCFKGETIGGGGRGLGKLT